MNEYFLSSDNDSHNVIVPENKRQEWLDFLDIPSEDERSWEHPEGVISIDGIESIIFTGWRDRRDKNV